MWHDIQWARNEEASPHSVSRRIYIPWNIVFELTATPSHASDWEHSSKENASGCIDSKYSVNHHSPHNLSTVFSYNQPIYPVFIYIIFRSCSEMNDTAADLPNKEA